MKIGIISDTHGLLHADVFKQFNDVDQIWHAGDMGDVKIISDLQTIAPVPPFMAIMKSIILDNIFKKLIFLLT